MTPWRGHGLEPCPRHTYFPAPSRPQRSRHPAGTGRVVSKEGLAVQKFPMTAEGLAKLEEELKQLKAEERPAVIRAIRPSR